MFDPDSIVVRTATIHDAPSLSRLRFALRSSVRLAPEARAAFIPRCTSWMAQRLEAGSRWRCWVAVARDVVVGCVWIQRVEKLPNPNGLPEDNAYLSNFFVAESHRERGVGSLLLESALAWCDADTIEITFLWPTARSRALYSRFGFSADGGIMERHRLRERMAPVART